MIHKKTKLSVIAVMFMLQPLPAKKIYMTIVMAKAERYMLKLDPISKTCHNR